ncbi:hypothetical protein [Kineococcus sp. SYSU DK018]|uniref:hypothetical protein n=1 Tax=Kineococcus sp. SYSU DK018 TaxID=3383139 RepID=UPI003D7EDCD3
MSFPSSPFGAAQEPAPQPPVEEERPTREVDPRVVKSLIAGAAVVAVLGAGTAGLLWLSSTPSGASAEAALGGARSTPSVTGSAAEVARAGAIDFSGRDAFAATVGVQPESESADVAEGSSTGTTSAAAATVASTSSSTPPSTSWSGSTTPPANGAHPSTTTPSSAPSTSTSASANPSDTRSTAPGWTVPQVSFVTGTDGYGVFRIAGEEVRITKGDLVYPLGIRYGGVVAAESDASVPVDGTVGAVQGVFTAENDAATGWVITSDPEGKVLLPGAVVGAPQGRARVYGVLADKFWVRVDRGQGVLYAVGDTVSGTGLTFLGTEPDDATLPEAGVYFEDGAGVVYFGTFGGGESDGVSF